MGPFEPLPGDMSYLESAKILARCPKCQVGFLESASIRGAFWCTHCSHLRLPDIGSELLWSAPQYFQGTLVDYLDATETGIEHFIPGRHWRESLVSRIVFALLAIGAFFAEMTAR